MARKKYNWINVENQSLSEWKNLCPVGEFRIVDPSKLPLVLSERLVKKYDSVFIAASGTQDGVVYYLANGNRVDYNDNAIDQQPFGIAFIGENPVVSGLLIQHGNWDNRTTYPPDEFWKHLAVSGIGTACPIPELPPTNSGLLRDLQVSSQQEAFNKIIMKIRSTFIDKNKSD